MKKLGLRLGLAGVLPLAVMAIAAGPASAVAPTSVTSTGGLHVCQGTVLDVTADTDATGGKILTATGEVCGAGTEATAVLTANVEATVGCITPPRSNEPRGLREVSTAVTASETFETRQGRGTFDVATEGITIEDFDFDCPSPNMIEVLVGPVTFTSIVLTITSQTGSITATFPDLDP